MIHTHLFVLGVLLFLILALFANSRPDILENRRAKTFYIMQNISLILFSAALLVRGIMQVLNIQLSAAANSTISGIAGVTHIMLTISLVLFFLLLKSVSKEAAVE